MSETAVRPGLRSNRERRIRLAWEIAIVLGLSLGYSAVFAIVQLIDVATTAPIASQTTTLNPSQSPRPLFDLLYQLLENASALVPVALVCFLLWQRRRPHLERLGIDGRHPGRDALVGVGLALGIGAGGILVYVGGRALGLTQAVDATGSGLSWWTVPALLFSAFRSGATEEIIVIAYLFERLGELRWRKWAIILSAAALRGTYHLYQGYSAFVGNFLLGVIFGWLYTRTHRVLPLVIAHTLIDAAVFIGYPWAAHAFPALFTTGG